MKHIPKSSSTNIILLVICIKINFLKKQEDMILNKRFINDWYNLDTKNRRRINVSKFEH